MVYETHVSRETPQSRAMPGVDQVENSAGGYVFAVDDWTRLERFLILGAEGGTYYVREPELTVDNAEAAIRCIREDGLRAVRVIREVSHLGRAPKNEPALFALILATVHGDEDARRSAWGALTDVARTGTHLFEAAKYRNALAGWGRLARNGFARWYTSKASGELARQVLKYPQRGGWSHRDVLRLCHPKGDSDQIKVFEKVAHPDRAVDRQHPLFGAVEAAQAAKTRQEIVEMIERYAPIGFSREMIPTEWLKYPEVWDALLRLRMPLGALVRNLANMTRIGLIKPMSEASRLVYERLSDRSAIRAARMHPLSLLVALKTYKSGKGLRGKGEWTPVPQVVDALDGAIQHAFEAVNPTGKRHVLGVDVSGSMKWAAAVEHVTAAEAAALMALVVAKTEPEYFIGGFTSRFVDLGITAGDSIHSALRRTSSLNFGSTDCSLPMLHAIENGIEADVFVVLTDNETWCGNVHPVQALEAYRQRTGIGAKLVVVGMTSTGFSIANPADAGMLDVVGLDTSVPAVIADFVRR